MSSYHIVQQGECLSSIARMYGFADYHSIYDDPANAKLKKLRGNPDVLHPGDRLLIPEKQKRQESAVTDQRRHFVLHRKRVFLELAVKLDDEPVTMAAYTLTVGGQRHTGTTNGEGVLSAEIDPGEETGHLHIAEPALDWALEIGHINPVTEVSGVQARLNNLDHPCDAADGVVGPRTRAALRQFQFRHGLKTTGAIDEPTRSALRKAHDGS